jgi:hypothetical protein
VFCQQAASHLVAQIGGGYFSLQLRSQLLVNREAKPVGRLNNRIPACLSIRTELLTFDKSDPPVSELEQVLQCQFRGTAVIEHNVRNLVHFVMPGNGDHG